MWSFKSGLFIYSNYTKRKNKKTPFLYEKMQLYWGPHRFWVYKKNRWKIYKKSAAQLVMIVHQTRQYCIHTNSRADTSIALHNLIRIPKRSVFKSCWKTQGMLLWPPIYHCRESLQEKLSGSMYSFRSDLLIDSNYTKNICLWENATILEGKFFQLFALIKEWLDSLPLTILVCLWHASVTDAMQ